MQCVMLARVAHPAQVIVVPVVIPVLENVENTTHHGAVNVTILVSRLVIAVQMPVVPVVFVVQAHVAIAYAMLVRTAAHALQIVEAVVQVVVMEAVILVRIAPPVQAIVGPVVLFVVMESAMPAKAVTPVLPIAAPADRCVETMSVKRERIAAHAQRIAALVLIAAPVDVTNMIQALHVNVILTV